MSKKWKSNFFFHEKVIFGKKRQIKISNLFSWLEEVRYQMFEKKKKKKKVQKIRKEKVRRRKCEIEKREFFRCFSLCDNFDITFSSSSIHFSQGKLIASFFLTKSSQFEIGLSRKPPYTLMENVCRIKRKKESKKEKKWKKRKEKIGRKKERKKEKKREKKKRKKEKEDRDVLG